MRSSNRLISTLLAAGLLLGAAGPALAGPAGVKAIVDDFNNDKRSDVAILNVSVGPNAGLQFGYLLTDPGFTLGLQNPIVQVPTGWVTLGFGDYNSDGIVDVVLQDKTGGAGDGLIFIFLMNNNLTPDVPNQELRHRPRRYERRRERRPALRIHREHRSLPRPRQERSDRADPVGVRRGGREGPRWGHDR
jgi:hypothetical protein